ncbi:MAG: cell division protein ZapE [Gammaproteobacteria bacterium]|nr:cell division protein ZapE [Gammaproteobacteria bacterium]
MTLQSIYTARIQSDNFVADPAQQKIISKLNQLYTELCEQESAKHQFVNKISRTMGWSNQVKGIYLWGGVGRGKTWLMDMFYDALPFKGKIRLHFHHFMQAVHDELTLLKGRTNPLILVARNFAKNTSILCLDEFHVADITDAMLLHGLLDELFKSGLTLVVTSNQQPDELYKNGLQRERFLPAIELIKQHTQILNIDGQIDHRLRLLERADIWYYPLSDHNNQQLDERFKELAPCKGVSNTTLQINYRSLVCRMCADDVAWFDFNVLCSGPRATADYIEIARCFHTVLISGIPQMDESQDDKAQRFINMIDEFYDRNVKLIATCETMPVDLYMGRQLIFDFQRTVSRLEEMRSHNYLSKPHRP